MNVSSDAVSFYLFNFPYFVAWFVNYFFFFLDFSALEKSVLGCRIVGIRSSVGCTLYTDKCW